MNVHFQLSSLRDVVLDFIQFCLRQHYGVVVGVGTVGDGSYQRCCCCVDGGGQAGGLGTKVLES